jgi:hypothetical protein
MRVLGVHVLYNSKRGKFWVLDGEGFNSEVMFKETLPRASVSLFFKWFSAIEQKLEELIFGFLKALDCDRAKIRRKTSYVFFKYFGVFKLVYK